MERSKELSFSVRNSGDAVQQAGLVGSTPGFVGDLQLLAAEELEARLQIHERIGGGSSARVYRGTLDGVTPVAVKVLHPHAAQREANLQEFLREAQVLARLQNKYIVKLHALAHLPPNFAGLPTRRFTWGIITEYMEAGSLTQLVKDAAKVYRQQQKMKQQLAAAALQSVGGGSSAAPERSSSLRNLRPTLSFLRRRSLTPAGDGAGPLSPRNRGGSVLPPNSATAAANAGGGGGLSAARLDSLTHEMPPLPYTDREAMQWCMEVALALQFLHAQTPPIVHRDVKTDNVLMTPLPSMGMVSASQTVGLHAGGAAATDGAATAGVGAGATGTSFTAGGGGSAIYSSHGSLARRVLSARAVTAAALAGEVTPSRQGSLTGGLVRIGGGRPLIAKICDFGLHVVLDVSRPVVTIRRRSYDNAYTTDGMTVGGGGGTGSGLPYSNSLTRRSTRHSPAGLPTGVPTVVLSPSASLAAAGGPMGPPSPLASLHHAGGGYVHSSQLSGHGLGTGQVGRYETRSRRSSMMSMRTADENGPFRRGISRDGDSFSRAHYGMHRKGSNVSHADSLEHTTPSIIAGVNTHVLTSVVSAGGSGSGGSNVRGSGTTPACGGSGGASTFPPSPPKPGPFAGSAAAAAAAAAAAFGSNSAVVGGIARLSPGNMVVGLRGGGGGSGGGGTYRSPKSSGPGTGPGPPKWSGGSALGGPQHAGLSSFAATRASLDLLLQGRLSATAAVVVASQSVASSQSVMMATGGGGSITGIAGGSSVAGLTGGGGGGGVSVGGGGSAAPLLPSSTSHVPAGGALETLSTGQMMLQLNAASTTGILDRLSRLRRSHAGPGDLGLGGSGGVGGGMSLEAALRIGNRSSSGRPSTAAAAVLLGAGGSGTGTETGMYGSVGSAANVGERIGSGTGSSTVLRAPRPSGGSPAGSSRGATRLRSNPAQVEKYLAMMEEDLQLDIASRSSSKAQVDMDPLYAPTSRAGSTTANHSRSGGPGSAAAAAGGGGALGGGVTGGGGGSGGGGVLGHGGTSSTRSLLSCGPSQSSISVAAAAPSAQQHLQQQQQQPQEQGVLSPATSVQHHQNHHRHHQNQQQPNQHQPGAPHPSTKACTGLSPGSGASAVATAALGVSASSRMQASGSGSGSGSGAVAAAPSTGGRISSVGPNSPSSPGARITRTNSTRSDQGMIVLTGVSCSGFGDNHSAGVGGVVGGGSGVAAVPAGVGGVGSSSIGTGVGGGGGGGGGFAAAGLRGLAMLARGPNPMKSSSQPAMSVSANINAAVYPHGGVPSPRRGPNPTKSSSQPTMSVSGPALMAGENPVMLPPPPPPPSGRQLQLAMSTSPLLMRHGSGGRGSGGGAPSHSIASGSGAGGGGGVYSPSRGPNPVKSSSQPVMSVNGMATAAACGQGGPVSSSRARDVSNAAGSRLVRTASHGSRVMSHLSMAGAPSSPTGSVHVMDLSPPVARVRSTRMGHGHLHAATATGPNAAAPAGFEAADGDILHQPENSASGPSNTGNNGACLTALAARRNRHPLEVALPTSMDAGGSDLPSSVSGSAMRARVLSPYGGSRSGSAGGDGGGGAATIAGRHWVATVTAAASPRTHSPSGTGSGSGAAAAAAAQLVTAISGGADSNILPMPPILNNHTGAAGLVPNRELHKVVKRLRPDGGSSFAGSGNSPLGLPPPPPMHHGSGGNTSSGGAVAAAGEAGSFTYSRRSSMDSHAPSYQSIGSARSATAATAGGSGALNVGGGGGGVGPPGLPSLYREKLTLGRGLIASGGGGYGASGSAAVGVSGVVASLAHSGPMLSGGLTSDPNSPVSSYVPAPGSSSLLGRAPVGAVRHHLMGPGGSLMGPMTGSVSASATAAASGPTMPCSVSGGVSASGNSGRQSSAGERSARQSSLVRQSSSTHSWGDCGTGGGGATATVVAHVLAGSVASGAASPSRVNTGGSMRALGHGGPSGPSVAAAAAAAAASSQMPSALASPMLAHVTGAGSQTSSTAASLGPQRMVSESAASSTVGGWTGRDDTSSQQGDPAYALTGRAGTLLYMAPEVIRHEPYNEKVDVFSFGVVLYEVFGRILLLELYNKDELEALSSRIAHGFRHSRPDCMPSSIWDLVQQCWAQNPADRPTMPLVVRQMELALEAMDEADGAAAANHSDTHRAGSLFGEGVAGSSGAVPGPAGSALVAGPGTGPGSAVTLGKDRSSGRSMASYKSLLSLGGSLGRRSRGALSFRRRGSHTRNPVQQPTAPTPGRPPPLPANASPQLQQPGSCSGPIGPLEFPRPPSSGSGLQSPASRGSVAAAAAGGGGLGQGLGLDSPGVDGFGFGRPRCAPCGCVVC